jgi:hypothetical protein
MARAEKVSRPEVRPVSFAPESGCVAILTHYLSPTDRRGARIVADAGMGRRVTVSYDYAENSEGRHRKAAAALCANMEWTGVLAGGGVESGGYAFVFLSPDAYAEPLAALKVLVAHAGEMYPHFESVRGQADIQRAETALVKAQDKFMSEVEA